MRVQCVSFQYSINNDVGIFYLNLKSRSQYTFQKCTSKLPQSVKLIAYLEIFNRCFNCFTKITERTFLKLSTSKFQSFGYQVNPCCEYFAPANLLHTQVVRCWKINQVCNYTAVQNSSPAQISGFPYTSRKLLRMEGSSFSLLIANIHFLGYQEEIGFNLY